jgi:hypothetical protein
LSDLSALLFCSGLAAVANKQPGQRSTTAEAQFFCQLAAPLRPLSPPVAGMGGPDLTPPSVPPPSPDALAAAGLDDDEEQQQRLPPASQSDDDLEGDDLAAAEQQQPHLPQVFPQIEHRALGPQQRQQHSQQFRPLHARGDLANRSNATRMLQQQKANARLHALQNGALLDEHEDIDVGGGDADATDSDDGGDSSSAASDASDPLVPGPLNSHRNQAPPPPSSFPSLQATEDVDQLGEDTPALVPLPPFVVPPIKVRLANKLILTYVAAHGEWNPAQVRCNNAVLTSVVSGLFLVLSLLAVSCC